MSDDLIALTADIVSAHVANNKVSTSEIAALIRDVHVALAGATAPAVADANPREPAVPIRSSVKPDYIVCLEDGAKLKMLKRYLSTRYNMTPDEYRAKWGLPRDYPMVCANYSERRRGLAHKIGLGTKKTVADDVVEAAPKKRGRPPKTSMSTEEALTKARARVSKPAKPQTEAAEPTVNESVSE